MSIHFFNIAFQQFVLFLLMLHITNLTKQYNSNTILNIPALHLNEGLYWLKGSNGSGKSTFLKIIAGLIPYKGNIKLYNYDLQKQPVAYKHCISYHPADAGLPSFVTGIELLQYYYHIRKGNSTVNDIVDLFKLQHFVKNKVATYSSGMQKKLSLALSFVGNPKLILLDEPLSTLDVDTAAFLTQTIVALHKNGTNFILTSHQDFEFPDFKFTNILQVQHQQITIL
jgi:ABC-2 type transport system ATP-binding protein